MARYRNRLPQLSGDLFLTECGIETTLIFHEGLNLPHFAAFDLLKHDESYETVLKCYRPYARLAQEYRVGLILESMTWRASADWGEKLGYSALALAEANRQAISMLQGIRAEYESERTRIVISGCIGPRGDGYRPSVLMNAEEAESYHSVQIGTLQETEADMICAMSLTSPEEAIGITHAAKAAGMPVVISFTVETDSRLPGGQSLHEAIHHVDEATEQGPAYYMINCAHPTHVETLLAEGGDGLDRIYGYVANASRKSHAELDEAAELDDGDPLELGAQLSALRGRLRHLNVLGGCCGTDPRHAEQILTACQPRS